MGQFTKDYRVEMTSKQKEALIRAAHTPVNYAVTKQNRNIRVVVDRVDGGRLVAKFYENLPNVDHDFDFGQVTIGPRGAILFNSVSGS